jgi:hypothetical protein
VQGEWQNSRGSQMGMAGRMAEQRGDHRWEWHAMRLSAHMCRENGRTAGGSQMGMAGRMAEQRGGSWMGMAEPEWWQNKEWQTTLRALISSRDRDTNHEHKSTYFNKFVNLAYPISFIFCLYYVSCKKEKKKCL